MDLTLTRGELTRLERCERRIAKGMSAFVGVGDALAEIQGQKLYRQQYSTFGAYCQDRWEISDNYARKLIRASQAVAEIRAQRNGTIVPLPATESQARPLGVIDLEQVGTVWQQVVERAPRNDRDQPRITAALVQQTVDSYQAATTSPPTLPLPAAAIPADCEAVLQALPEDQRQDCWADYRDSLGSDEGPDPEELSGLAQTYLADNELPDDADQHDDQDAAQDDHVPDDAAAGDAQGDDGWPQVSRAIPWQQRRRLEQLARLMKKLENWRENTTARSCTAKQALDVIDRHAGSVNMVLHALVAAMAKVEALYAD